MFEHLRQDGLAHQSLLDEYREVDDREGRLPDRAFALRFPRPVGNFIAKDLNKPSGGNTELPAGGKTETPAGGTTEPQAGGKKEPSRRRKAWSQTPR